ncbi:hypothetical protein PFLG_01713 [Plasmodium falciparum RAJ116]|uniref:Uncharacterized protein n=1 Tax=Plasmodium falciparum RAJ116 TaxID=580058 RepID=A0A0L0CVD8_PLAFA|nr:hypothetical protein PFLG_01713 [Plasmodium falciparum RAJ116]
MVLPIPNESSVSWPATFYLRNSRTRNRTCVTSKKTYIPSHWIIGTTKIFYIYKINEQYEHVYKNIKEGKTFENKIIK